LYQQKQGAITAIEAKKDADDGFPVRDAESRSTSAWIGERGRIRTCDPCLKRRWKHGNKGLTAFDSEDWVAEVKPYQVAPDAFPESEKYPIQMRTAELLDRDKKSSP